MASMERETQKHVDLMASARDLNKRFELVSENHQRVLLETKRLQELVRWQRFFGYETNAIESFEKLARDRSQEARRRGI